MSLSDLSPSQLTKILNVAYPEQAVDLINGIPKGPICGYHKNNDSNNQSWRFMASGNNEYIIQNGTAPRSFASITAERRDNKLRGSLQSTVWRLIPLGPNVFQIQTQDEAYLWVLSSGDDYAPIVIKAVEGNEGSEALWTFEAAPRVD